MLETTDKSKYSGKFFIDGKVIDGELSFEGTNTNLLLHHPSFFRPDEIADQCAHGILRNLTRVSLFGCLTPPVPASSWSQDLGSYSSATVRPHFVLHGSCHLSPNDKLIKSIRFTPKDGSILFPDYDAFSTTVGSTPDQLRFLLQENERISKRLLGGQRVPKRRIRIGKYPQISYFTGKHQIFKAKTVIGMVSAHHAPSFDFGGPKGVSIKNEIVTRIAFDKPVRFADAIDSLRPVLSFFEIVAGRRQELENMRLDLKGKTKLSPSDLNIYWCYPFRREFSVGRDPHPIDLPINAALRPTAFANILARWLERHEAWKEARYRFSESFAMESTFSTDRLIGSANMFDLLPASAVPKSIALSEDLRRARGASQILFKALPSSAERDSVLAVLGRLGHPSLKRKVRHRAGLVVDMLGQQLPHLVEVLDLAIDARNHFVHGTESKIDYVTNFFETAAFFCRTLEFVFVVSDLIEAGWDAKAWRKNGTTGSHPLASFLPGYPHGLQRLQEVWPAGHRLKAVK